MEKAVKEIAKELKLIRRELQKKETVIKIDGEKLTETIEVFDVREAKRKSWRRGD